MTTRTHEYDIEGFYPPYGWELLTCEETFPEAKSRLREYRENEPEHVYRIKRVKIEN